MERTIKKRLLGDPRYRFSGFILFVLIAVSFIGPLVWNIDVYKTNAGNSFDLPSTTHLLGTDALGRDVAVRIILGARTSILVGLVSTLTTGIIAFFVGWISAYNLLLLDRLLMRITDLFLGVPPLLFLLLVEMIFRNTGKSTFSRNAISVSIFIGLVSWMELARLLRVSFRNSFSTEYVIAARSLGGSEGYVFWKHILPNSYNLIIVNSTLIFGSSILYESGLSYLGFGIQPPFPSLGNLIQSAQLYLFTAPWLGIFPGVVISVIIVCVNLVGDSLADATNPKVVRRIV